MPLKVEALTVRALDRLVFLVKRGDRSVPLWIGCVPSLRIQVLRILAACSATAVQADLPLPPPAHIGSLGPRCRAQSVEVVVVCAPCRNPARRELMGNCGMTIQRRKAR